MAFVEPPGSLRRRFASWLLGLFGWKPVLVPPPGPKFVTVGYPHTSNWDFFPAILWAWTVGLHMNFVGKKELFKGPLGPLMRALGGIQLDRDKSANFVQQMAEVIRSREKIALIIAAEGTRSRTEYWRSGFYYMALEAGVPIALGYLDYSKGEVGIGAYLVPTGDIQSDFEAIKAFYKDKVGKYPDKQGVIALKPS